MAPIRVPAGVSQELSDAVVVARVRAGDLKALATAYERHARMVMAVAYRLTASRADAEDVLHDVFLGLPEALQRYEERGSFASWLKRVVVRAALMQKRRLRRNTPIGAEIPAPSTGDASQTFVDRVALDRALKRLPRDLRHVFVLKEIEGYSHAEIGQLLGIRKNTSEVRLHRAIKRLRRMLSV